jgi:hypothetical protein
MTGLLTTRKIQAARAIAVGADLIQLGLFPLFGEGALSVWNDALDVGVALVLIRLLGWHWILLPSLVAESVPGLNLVPTWTAAVLFLTRGGVGPAPPEGPPPVTPPEVLDVHAQRIGEDRRKP